MPTVTRRELVLVFLWSAAVMALTAVPYHLASRWAGPGRQFCGFIWGVDDGNAYLSWVRQAAEGRVLLRNQYTTKDQNPRFLNLFLLALGRVCHWTGLTPLAVFMASRYLCGVFCLAAFYVLAAQLSPSVRARWWALALASLSSGLGWLAVLGGPQGFLRAWLGAVPVDVADGWQAQPEAILFPSLLLNPLFAISLGLVCLTMAAASRLCHAQAGWKPVVAVGALLLLLGNVHGYDIFAIHATLLMWLGSGWLLGRISLPQAAGRYATIVALSAASPIWGYLGTKADPSYAAKVNTATLSPRPFDIALGYGLVLALAVAGAWLAVRHADVQRRSTQRLLCGLLGLGIAGLVAQQLGAPGWALKLPVLGLLALAVVALRGCRGASAEQWRALLPVVWVVCGAAALYLPLPFQRKLIEGLHIPLCLLGGPVLAAVVGGASVFRGMERGTRWFIAAAALLATMPSNAILVNECLRHTRDNARSLLNVRTPPSYLSLGEVRAMQSLANRATDEDVVLSSSLTGSHIPAHARCRVWVGHWAETLDFGQCVGLAERFYDPRSSRETRTAILATVQPTHVWYGPQERLLQEAMGGPAQDPCKGLPDLTRVGCDGGVDLYEVAALGRP